MSSDIMLSIVPSDLQLNTTQQCHKIRPEEKSTSAANQEDGTSILKGKKLMNFCDQLD